MFVVEDDVRKTFIPWSRGFTEWIPVSHVGLRFTSSLKLGERSRKRSFGHQNFVTKLTSTKVCWRFHFGLSRQRDQLYPKLLIIRLKEGKAGWFSSLIVDPTFGDDEWSTGMGPMTLHGVKVEVIMYPLSSWISVTKTLLIYSVIHNFLNFFYHGLFKSSLLSIIRIIIRLWEEVGSLDTTCEHI